MAEQPELDLPPVPASAPDAVVLRPKAGFGGFTRHQIFIGVLLLAIVVWGMWVTKTLAIGKQDHIVAARLSSLVGEYVEAQRFSGSPPERVKAEMQAFMASLDKELQRRSENGQVVLVGEAVLTKNVPDITDSIKKAIFASGVPEPRRISVEDLQRMQQLSAAQATPADSQPPLLTSPATIDPMAAAQGFPAQDPSLSGQKLQQVPPPMPGASVSTFGGPGGDGGQ